MSDEYLPVFSGYNTISLLGEGASSRVFLAVDQAGNKFAIKALRQEFASDNGIVALLEAEARSLTKLNHPRIAKFVSFSTELNPLPHIVTEYVEGKSLKQMVEEKPLSGPILLSMSKGLLEGLRAIHDLGIIHKDLKPANIVFTEDGVKLIDFGISVYLEDEKSSETDQLAATPGWLSPEQANGLDLSTATDIFNFGLVLSFAATGKHAFGEGSPDAILYRIANGNYSLADLPNWLKPVVSSCLERDPSSRPTLDQLHALLNRPGTSSQPESNGSDSTTLASGTVLSGAARNESMTSPTWDANQANQRSNEVASEIKPRRSSGPGWKTVTGVLASVALLAGFVVALNLPGRGPVEIRVLEASTMNPIIGEGAVLVEGPGWSEEVKFDDEIVRTLKGEWISNRQISFVFTSSFSEDATYSKAFYPEDYGANILGNGEKLILEFNLNKDSMLFVAKVFTIQGLAPTLDLAIEERLPRGNEYSARLATERQRLDCRESEVLALEKVYQNTLNMRDGIYIAEAEADLDWLGEGRSLAYSTWQSRFRKYRDGIDDLIELANLEEPEPWDSLTTPWQEALTKMSEFRDVLEDWRFASAIQSDSRFDDANDRFWDARELADVGVADFDEALKPRATAICLDKIPYPE